jgi:membrane protease YdiL (CAAX protease family)
MNVPTATAPAARVRSFPPWALTACVLAVGYTALLARPVLLPPGQDPTARLVCLFVLLGLVGAWWPVRAEAAGQPGRGTVALALGLGSAAFVVGRFATGGPAAAHPLFFRSLVLNALAAVAEEAFFRRLLYGVLLPAGPGVALAGTAVAFAVAHVTVWGLWVLPLDLAAGLLLSWQRAASGRWAVPAATHVLANALALV